MKIKVRNVLLLIVVGLFFCIGNVFADASMKYLSSKNNLSTYQINYLNTYNNLSYNYVELNFNSKYGGFNTFNLTVNDGWKVYLSKINNKYVAYFVHDGLVSGTSESFLGSLVIDDISKYDMSIFPGTISDAPGAYRCEYEEKTGVFFDKNGNIVSEAEYIRSCKSSDSGSTDGDDTGNSDNETNKGNTGDTGSGSGASNGSSSSDGKNESNSESNSSTSEENKTNSSESTNSSSSSESKSDSASKDGDVNNPNTGAGLQYGILLILIGSAIFIGYYIKKHNKIHKI